MNQPLLIGQLKAIATPFYTRLHATAWLDAERTAGFFLTPEEKALLPYAPKVIALELAIRFLTDHLLGGVYFRSDYEGHNLARARNQLTLLKSM